MIARSAHSDVDELNLSERRFVKILVINCGSSSLKVGVFEIGEKSTEIFKATYEKFEAGYCSYKITSDGKTTTGKRP